MRAHQVISLAALLLASSPVLADDDQVPPVTNPLVLKECGGCHMAFQPAFLPAASWNSLMDNLSRHFGEDASLPADQVAAIRAYLTRNAGGAHRGRDRNSLGEPPTRITETTQFLRKHRFKDAVWKDPKVVTKSNCPACHGDAERGWYED